VVDVTSIVVVAILIVVAVTLIVVAVTLIEVAATLIMTLIVVVVTLIVVAMIFPVILIVVVVEVEVLGVAGAVADFETILPHLVWDGAGLHWAEGLVDLDMVLLHHFGEKALEETIQM
jgi:hypothetical protein